MHWGAGLWLKELEASIKFCVLSWCSWAGGRDSYSLGWSFIVFIVSVLSAVAWPFVSIHLYLPFPFVDVALCVHVLRLFLWGGAEPGTFSGVVGPWWVCWLWQCFYLDRVLFIREAWHSICQGYAFHLAVAMFLVWLTPFCFVFYYASSLGGVSKDAGFVCHWYSILLSRFSLSYGCVAVLHSYFCFLFLLGGVPPFLLCWWLYYLARGACSAVFLLGWIPFCFYLYFLVFGLQGLYLLFYSFYDYSFPALSVCLFVCWFYYGLWCMGSV